MSTLEQRALEIGEAGMRGYCTGKPVPRYVLLALERLVELERMVTARDQAAATHLPGPRP